MAQEKQFERKVKTFLKDQGAWTLKTWSNGVQRSGVPDLLICHKGHFIGIELKAPKGKPSELQLHNLKTIDEAGGYSILLYPDKYLMFKLFIQSLTDGFIKQADDTYRQLKKEEAKWQVCTK